MTIDLAREYVVIVNGGSGCIVQPMSEAYLYILTAKHNIVNHRENAVDIVGYKYKQPGLWEEYSIDVGVLQDGINCFPHPEKDIAIIKIPVKEGLDHAYRFDHIGEDKKGFQLLGYPESRREREKKEWYRMDDFTIKDDRGGHMYEGEIKNMPELKEVRGASGGCICKVEKGRLLIAGVQNRMAEKDEKEQLGNVRFTSMKAFDEIVAMYPANLAAIFPCHLGSFSFLKSEAFKLDAGFSDANIIHVRNFLRQKMEDVIKSNMTPSSIKQLFEDRLLLYNESTAALQTKIVWATWLEFLTIINLLVEEQVSMASVEKLFNRVRLLCTDTDGDWSGILENLLYADYKGLPKNSVVVVGAKKAPYDNTYVIDKAIPYIDNVISKTDSDLLKIDAGISSPLYDYSFVHMQYFKQHAIVDKHSEYKNIKNDEALILAKLKEEYNLLMQHE